jgi:hypothetical protein
MYSMERFVAEQNIELIIRQLQTGSMDQHQITYMQGLLTRTRAELKQIELRSAAGRRRLQ